MTRRILAAALLLIATIAAAEKPPAIELGFKPEKVYSFGSLDNVNLFNGNMIFTIPLGLRYPVSSNLSYGLTLVYNSKAWDYYYVESWQDPSDVRAWAKPNIRSNAGMGWRLSLGRLIPPTSSTITTGYVEGNPHFWTYEGPNGDEHSLGVTAAGGSAVGSVSRAAEVDQAGYNTYFSSSSIRMYVATSTSRQIQFPTGEVHTFTYERNAWRLTRMADAFSNAVTIAYSYDTSDRTTQWTISDAMGRTHTIAFINSPYLSESIDRGQMVKTITMKGVGPTSATNVTYTFNYTTPASVAYSCKHSIPIGNPDFTPSPTATRATVPLLASVSLPDGSSWAFTYNTENGTGCASGLLKDVTLPTLGKMAYEYQIYTIPANDWCSPDGPSNSSPGVSKRTLDGNKTWLYKQTIGPVARTYTEPGYKYTCGPESTEGEQSPFYPMAGFRWKRTSVIAPAHDGTAQSRTDHYFSVWRTGNPLEEDLTMNADERPVFEYGYPASAGWPGALAAKGAPPTFEYTADVSAADDPADAAPRYLMEQTWTGCTATGDCSAPTAKLLQSKYMRAADFDSYRLTSSESTYFNDDGGCPGGICYARSNYSEHDGVGNLRKVVESGNFNGDTQATTRTEYPAWTSSTVNSGAVKWITTRYTEKSRTIGTRTSRTLYCFGTTGELLRTRALVNGASDSTNDVLDVYAFSAGNVTAIRSYGGDALDQALPVGTPLCTTSLTGKTPQYRTGFSWSYGALASEWPVDPAAAQPLLFKTRDYVRHPGTGLVTQSNATDGLPTTFGYTAWGALASVTPPGESQTTYTYTRATSTGAPAKVTASRGDATFVYEYDVMGRLAREQKTLPGAGCVQRLLTYDAFSRLANETSWHGCAAASPGATTYKYDALGRQTSVATPDGKIATTAYTGARFVERSSSVALATGDTSVAQREEYDRFGRLIDVREDFNGIPQITTYGYDEADRLTRVTMESQTRLFAYDGRGFLTSEQHPELANGITQYREYDARGHARRRTTGPDNGVFDIRFAYDPAERVTLVTRVSDGRKLKELVYDDPDGIFCGGQICRGKLAAAARYHWDADLSNTVNAETLAVTESYKYDAATGRPTRRDRAIGTTSLFTGNSFYTFQSHNSIGAVASVSYPCSDVAGCPQGTQRVVNYGYTNGVLTSVGNWASSITYAPSGIIDTVRHGASGAAGSEVWTRDAFGMARPLSIAAKSPANVTLWTSGNYAYDGSGNIKSIGTMSYAYDRMHRLVRWTQNAADGATTWTGREYDRYGNPIYGTSGNCGAGGLGCTSTSGLPRTIAGTTNGFADTTYDAAGNVTADSGRSFTYDGLVMMTRAQIGTRHFRYLYSVDDERIAAIEKLTISGAVKFKTTYTIRGFENQLLGVWQTDPATNAASWVEDEIHRGSAVLARERATGGTTHYFLDHLGSPRALTSATGTLLGTQQFDPWGFGGTTGGGALQFTAHERDAALYGTGNTAFPDYMHARYYDVGGGRFLAMDPARASARPANPQTWNRYAYARNNPMNRIDRDGLIDVRCNEDRLITESENVLVVSAALDKSVAEGVEYGAIIGRRGSVYGPFTSNHPGFVDPSLGLDLSGPTAKVKGTEEPPIRTMHTHLAAGTYPFGRTGETFTATKPAEPSPDDRKLAKLQSAYIVVPSHRQLIKVNRDGTSEVILDGKDYDQWKVRAEAARKERLLEGQP